MIPKKFSYLINKIIFIIYIDNNKNIYITSDFWLVKKYF